MFGLQSLLQDGHYSIIGLTGSDADYSILVENATGRVYHIPHPRCPQANEHAGSACGLITLK